MDEKSNYDQIAQFSARDAEAFVKYEKFLSQLVDSIDPLFDIAPPRFASNTRGLAGTWDNLQSWRELMRSRKSLSQFLLFYTKFTVKCVFLF